MALTESAEDYLEAIYVISQRSKVVRVKDVAKQLKVKMSSVVVALKALAQKGLIEHEYYGYIELTEEGRKIAEEIYSRHKSLFKFLHQTLGLEEEVAARDACRIEHYVSPETMNRIVKFTEFIETCPEGAPSWLTNFYYFVQYGKRGPCPKKIKGDSEEVFPLNRLQAGQMGEVIKLIGDSSLKQRLLKSGIVPGEVLKVMAPAGEAVEIAIQDTQLSLNQEEAANILVKEVV